MPALNACNSSNGTLNGTARLLYCNPKFHISCVLRPSTLLDPGAFIFFFFFHIRNWQKLIYLRLHFGLWSHILGFECGWVLDSLLRCGVGVASSELLHRHYFNEAWQLLVRFCCGSWPNEYSFSCAISYSKDYDGSGMFTFQTIHKKSIIVSEMDSMKSHEIA